MTYGEAQAKFNVRLYQWAEVALEKEIEDSFPSFQRCTGWTAKTRDFFQCLDRDSQLVLGEGLLQARHQNAVKALGERASIQAEALMRREEDFRNNESIKDRLSSAGNRENKAKLATRQQLKKAISAHFRSVFGDQCLPPDPLVGKNDVRFQMKCRGWIIKTGFEFGRWDPEIRYHHYVWTGKLITKEEPEVLPINCIGIGLNYGNEVGIGSGWDTISLEDIEPTCAAVIEHCRRMFDVFPGLLKGLDLELLT